MIYDSKVYALAKSITFKSIWTAFRMNNMLVVSGLPVPDDKKLWRYFMHLAGDRHELDDVLYIDSLDTNEQIPFDRDTLKKHKKTNSFYKDSTNRQKILTMYPLYDLYIDGVYEPVSYKDSISAEDGDILRYNTDLVERQEFTLISELAVFIKAEHHLYFMESWAAMYPGFVMWFMAKVAAMLPGKIHEHRLKKLHTQETHSTYITEYLRSHKRLDKYIPYLTLEQKMFLYRNIRYIERNIGTNETFEMLVENLLTKAAIPLDGYDLNELYDNIDTPLLVRQPVGFKVPINFQDRSQGRDVEIISLDIFIDKETESGQLHDRVLDTYRTLEHKQLSRSKVLKGPTKLLEVSGVDPEILRTETFLDRLVYDWCYYSTKGDFNVKVDIIDPSTGNNIRLSAHEAFVVFIYAYYKGYHDVELKRIPPFNCSEQETGYGITGDDYISTLPHYGTRYIEEHVDFYIDSHVSTQIKTTDRTEFYNESHTRWLAKGLREKYISSQTNDPDRATAEYLYRYTYREHFLQHESVGDNYIDTLYRYGFTIDDYSNSVWCDLCSDLLKLTVDYDPESTIGFGERQKNLVELFQKLSSYTIQMTSVGGSSETISNEATGAMVLGMDTSELASVTATYDSGLLVDSSTEKSYIVASVIANDGIFPHPIGTPTITLDYELGVAEVSISETDMAFNYESSAIATAVE